jgi:hypothetical protein
VKREKEVRILIVLLLILASLFGCASIQDIHPELNRDLDPIAMKPGEYPY